MAKGCRDCEVCTRSAITNILRTIHTILYLIFLSWNYGLFQSKCPDCGHFLSQHRRRADGSFTD